MFEELALAFPNRSLEKKPPSLAGGGVGVSVLDGGAVTVDVGGSDDCGIGEGASD
jgi:hypothetical protein